MDLWIVGGDFNNRETMEDQQGRGPEIAGIAQAEQSAWDSFLFRLEGETAGGTPPFVVGKGVWTTLGDSEGKGADFWRD